MSNDKDVSEISDELREIKDEMRKIEKQSRFGAEDQFFFAISFSLLILFLTLSVNDLILFLQNFGLTGTLANNTASGIRIIGIGTALVASFLRYYGSMCSERVCKVKRAQSIITLLIGFWFFIFIIGANAFFGLTLTTNLVTIPLGIAVLIVFYAVLFFVEGRILSFYAARGLIQKSNATPIVSPMFMFICMSYYLSFVVFILVSFFAPNIAAAVGGGSFLISFMVFFVIQAMLYFRVKKPRRRNDGSKRSKSIQKTLLE